MAIILASGEKNAISHYSQPSRFLKTPIMDAFDIDYSSLLASWALAPEAPRPLLVARICSRGPTLVEIPRKR